MNAEQRRVFGLGFVGYALYVLCRKAPAFALPAISKEVPIDQLGVVVSAQNLAYSASKFGLALLIGDRVGPRVALSGGLAVGAVSLLLFSSSSSSWARVGAGLGNGLGQGAGWPSLVVLLTRSFPPEQLGSMWSFLSASANVTGIAVPLLLPSILRRLGGWRGFMRIAGTLGLAWASMIYFLLPERAASETQSHATESKGSKDDSKKPKRKGDWQQMVRSPFLWWLFLFYFIVFATKTACEYWASLLLMERKGFGAESSGAFLGWLELGGFLSSFPTGYVTDWAIQRKTPGSHSNPRMFIALLYTMGSVASLQIILTSSSMLSVNVAGFALGSFLYSNIIIFGVVGSEEAGSGLAATSHAVVSLGANLGGVTAGWPLSVLGLGLGWAAAFRIVQGALLLSAAAMAATLKTDHRIAQ